MVAVWGPARAAERNMARLLWRPGGRFGRQPGLPERGMARQLCRLRVWLWRFMEARLQVSGIVAGQVFMTADGPGDALLSVTAQGTGSTALPVADIRFIITNVQEFRA